MRATERIQQLLHPSYVAGLGGRSLDDLRAMRAECGDAENALSYYRRLAQARLEILDAVRARRDRGGRVDDLVADLPQILGADASRSTVTTTRVAAAGPPAAVLRWPDGRERLVADDTLAKLPSLDDRALASTIDALGAFERELSDARRGIHTVIDALDREIATRQVAGTAG